MPSASQRFAALLASGAALFRGASDFALGLGDPRPSPGTPPGYETSSRAAPSVKIPGVTPFSSPRGASAEDAARALLTPEAYLGLVSRDAGPTLTRFSSWPATDLSPEKIAGAQQEAAAGYPLRWVEMVEQVLGRDAHLSGIGQQRVDDVVKGSWRLTKAVNDPLSAYLRSFAEEVLRGVDSLDDAMAWLLWGNAYGYAACEVVWRRERVTFPGPDGKRVGPIDALVPSKLVAMHPKHVRFDLRTDEPLLWLGSSNQSFPFGKFVFYRGEGQNPITERRGYMWPCAWLAMFKAIGWAGWAAFVDRFGMPTPLVEYDGTLAQYDEYQRAMAEVLDNLGSGRGAIFPKNSISVRGLEFPQGGRASDPHSALSDACDAAMSVRIHGATLSSKMGNVGSFASTNAHVEVKYAKEEADARRLWATLRADLVAPIVAFNARAVALAVMEAGEPAPLDAFPRRVPRGMQRVPREVDPTQRMSLVESAVRMGMRVGASGMFDEFNFPQPDGPEDFIRGEPEPVTKGGKLVGSVEASTEGADAPEEPGVAATAPGGESSGGAGAGGVALTATDVATIVTVNEARRSQGLAPWKDVDGELTVAQFKAKHADVVATAAAADGGKTEPEEPAAPAQATLDFNPGEPRAADGKWGAGGAAGAAAASKPAVVKWSATKTRPVPKRDGKPGAPPGKQLPGAVVARLKSLGVGKLPAAHIGEVGVSQHLAEGGDPHAGALLKWRDDKGMEQRVYSAEFDRRNAEQKWARVLASRPKVARAAEEMGSRALESPAHAAAALIAETGLRPGGRGDSVEKGHYGVTTMEARHVTFSGVVAQVEYVGKEGVVNRATVDDPRLVAALKKNVAGKKPDEKVFDVGKAAVAAAAPKGVKLKDFRTVAATNLAEAQLARRTPELTGDRKKDARQVLGILREVSAVVAQKLNNTPVMARRNYIAPQVIRAWAERHGLPEEWVA